MDSTSRSSYPKYKYSTSYTSSYSSPISTSLSPYKRFSQQYTTPIYKTTPSTITSLATSRITPTNDYISNNIYDNPSSTTTTTRTYGYQNYVKNNYRYTSSSTGLPKTNSSPNDASYPKITPFKYKTSVTSTSLTTASNGNQYGSSIGDGKRIVTENYFFSTFSLVHDSSSSFCACGHLNCLSLSTFD